ncbi:MAG: hypothetical protein GEU83_21225 [Pseudonocardiaceae bacterium]|nr:hypothetical protein [Pseudonocardiaceae bacterium]
MIRADRELLAEMARVNNDVAPLAMRIMDGSATPDEQRDMAGRLVELAQRLGRRAEGAGDIVEGHVVADQDSKLSTIQRLER